MKANLRNKPKFGRQFGRHQCTSFLVAIVFLSTTFSPGLLAAAPGDNSTGRSIVKNAAAAVAVSTAIKSNGIGKAADPVTKSQIVPLVETAHGAGVERVARRQMVEMPETIQLFDFKDPDTGKTVKFSYQPSTLEELRKFSPSKVRMMTQGVPEKGSFLKATKKLSIDFPPEYLAFTIAVGISTMIHLDNDPAFVHNFVESNTSKEGVISFFGFVAASRASHSVMQAFGMAYDPRRAPLDYRLQTPYIPGETKMVNVPGVGQVPMQQQGRYDHFNTKIVASPMGPTRFQRNFAPLLGPIGLSAGMITSNIIHEVMADPNLHLCAKAKLLNMKVPTDPEAAKLATAAVDEACDKTWEDWALQKKFADYAPDLVSMSMASLIHAYVVNKGILAGAGWATKKAFVAGAEAAGVTVAKNAYTGRLVVTAAKEGAETATLWVMRGLRIGGITLNATPWGKLISTVGNIAVFMEIVHPITPLIKQPFERVRQGSDITKRVNDVLFEIGRAEKNQWVWKPRPDSDFCQSIEVDQMGTSMVNNMDCFVPDQFTPSFLLKKMAERQAKWREFILADAYLAHANWQKYVSQFATNYANATAFYHQMFSHINYMRNAPADSRAQSYLYQPAPFNGLYSDPANRDMPGARKAVIETAAWLKTYLDAADVKAKSGIPMAATEKEYLPTILTGLRAIDPEVDLKMLGAVEFKLGNFDSLNPDQRRVFEAKVRSRMVEDAIRLLRKVLKEDPKFNDGRMQVTAPAYKRFAETNPFMALRLRLGDPEPLAAGVSFIRQSNDDQQVIEQSSKDQHPDRIGRIRTSTMADYLTVSMVCGPEADPRFSDEEKLKIYRDRKLSAFESILDHFGLGTPMAKPSEAEVMIAVNEFADESTKNFKSWTWLPWFKPNATGVEWKGFRAEFRPPKVVDGVPSYLCKDWAKNSDRDPKNLDYDPYDAKWTINGKDYDGILDIIRQLARTDIVGSTLPPKDDKAPYDDPFEKWWTDKVDKNVVQMVAQFRANFRLLVKEKYLPALTRNGVDGAVEYNGRPIKLGALESLYDEAKLYLLIIGKTGQVTKDTKVRKHFDDLSTSVLLEFKNVGQLVSDIDFVEQKGTIANAAYETKRKELEAKVEDLKKFVEERRTAMKPSEEISKMNDQTLKNLSALMGEMDSYWGIVRSIQVEAH